MASSKAAMAALLGSANKKRQERFVRNQGSIRGNERNTDEINDSGFHRVKKPHPRAVARKELKMRREKDLEKANLLMKARRKKKQKRKDFFVPNVENAQRVPMIDQNGASINEMMEQNRNYSTESANDQSGTDSIRDGKDAFNWLIAPVKPEAFFSNAWENAPLHVKRTNFPDYYKDVLSSNEINNILRDNYVLFSKNIDVTSYAKGERKTLNPPGRATPSVVWDYYKNGCSIRMLNPQTFSTGLRKLNATLQDYFGCFVGANSYLTPAKSQGFAPHYDDIEAFILQIEGRKQWKVYAPRTDNEVLPRFSSPNFSQEELDKPILEVTLHPGDLLYFPRGFIHQACTEPGYHSLHVTVSCYQKNTWGDLMEKLIPATLALAQEYDEEFRRGLPLNYLRHAGVSNSELETQERRSFLETIGRLFDRLLKYAPVDAAVDQMGKQFMHDALPPVLTEEEKNSSVFSENIMKLNENGIVTGRIMLNENTRVKLIRSHILRLVKEDDDSDNVQIYHCVDNSLEYHGEEPMMFEVTSEQAVVIETLVHTYPAFTLVSDFELDERNEKVEFANLLWKKGLLLKA